MLHLKDDLNTIIVSARAGNLRLRDVLNAVRRQWLRIEFTENKGNSCRVARSMGLHRNTIDRAARQLGIDKKTFSASARRPVQAEGKSWPKIKSGTA